MAGLGFKDFQVGEVLTSADVDGYLMQQAVMRFADSGARGSALGTAAGTGVALAEGMVSYLDDANYVQVYNGVDWVSAVPGIGTNIVQAVKTDTFSTSSNTFVTVTDVTATITPSSANSKILVIVSGVLGNSSTTAETSAHARIAGGNSGAYIGDAASNRERAAVSTSPLVTGALDSRSITNNFCIVYLDSPATTSPVTYSLEIRRATGGNAVVGRTGIDTNVVGYGRNPTSITAIEVAA